MDLKWKFRRERGSFGAAGRKTQRGEVREDEGNKGKKKKNEVRIGRGQRDLPIKIYLGSICLIICSVAHSRQQLGCVGCARW